jgi:hypothetical protein
MTRTISDLPNELLISCIEHLQNDRANIIPLRLVSKRFHDLSSRYLLTTRTVYFTKDSFKNLSTIVTHPTFKKHVSSLVINVSYYETIYEERLDLFRDLVALRHPQWAPCREFDASILAELRGDI